MPVIGGEAQERTQVPRWSPHRGVSPVSGGWQALKRRGPWTEAPGARASSIGDVGAAAGSVAPCGCGQEEGGVESRGERCERCRRCEEDPVEEEDGQHDADRDNLLRGLRAQTAKQEKLRCPTTLEPADQSEYSGEFPAVVDFEGESFELGPPPPSGPTLCRQNAVDFTVTREAKRAGFYGARAGSAGAQTAARPALRANRRLPTAPSTDLGRFVPV